MRKLCDVHMAIFKEQLEKQQPDLQPSQPISILMEEHKIMLKMAEQLIVLANRVLRVTDMRYAITEIHEIEHLAEDFTDSEKHYLREENVLFPASRNTASPSHQQSCGWNTTTSANSKRNCMRP